MAQGSSNPTTDLKKIAGTNVSVNTGNADAGTQRVVLATNQPVIPISDNGSSLTVDGTVTANQGGTWNIGSITTLPSLPTGSNTIGSVNQAGTWNISNISGTVSLPTGAATAANQSTEIASLQLLDDAVGNSGTAIATGMYRVGGTDGTNNRLLSVNTSGHVNIADGGNSITVDGTVSLGAGAATIGAISNTSFAATQSGTWNIGTVTSITNSVAVTGPLTDAQLRATAVPVSGTVSVNALPAGTNNIGDVDVLSLPALPTGSNTIGNVNAIQSGTWTVQPGNTANTTPWLIRHSEQLGTATALGALNANISQALLGNNGVAAVITATATPSGITLTPQVSYDGGTNWVNAKFFDAATETALATLNSFTVGASYIITASSGATNVRVIATAWVSGSVTVRLSATNANGLVSLLSGAEHDAASGSFVQLMGAVASSTAPTAVSANGDAVRLWATTNGALNIADGGSSITVDGAVTVSGTVSVNALPAGTNNIGDVDVLSLPALPTGSNTIGAVNQAGTWNIGSITTLPSLPAGTNNIGDVDVLTLPAVTIAAAQTLATVTTVGTVTSLSQFAGQAINLGAGTTGTGTLRVVEASAATATQTNPSLSTTSATVLAANTARRGASVFNGSTSIVFLRLSATAASSTVYTTKLQPDDYYEVPSYYNGAITGILNTGSTTLVQVTEIT